MGNPRPDQQSRITVARRQKPDSNHLVDGKYAIADLVDLEELKKLFQGFSDATGFTIGFLDHPGLNVLIATGWLDICTEFHRANPLSACACLKSNLHLLGQLSQPLQTSIEKCQHGLVDCATPIIIKGKHIASLATGQLLLAPPVRERFRRQAAVYGYDEKAYLAALEKVAVVDEGKLQRITAFLGTLAQMISEKGYVNLLHKEKAGRLQAEIKERGRVESALRESEALLQKANRMLQAIRDCHESMLRANTEEELLQGVCRIIVQTGGQTAWVGLAEQPPRRTVRPVAAAGISAEYLKRAHITWDNTPRGRGPVGTAIHTGKPYLCRNTLTDPKFAPWRQLARQFGFGSVLALPLVINGQCIGALVIKAPQPDAFDAGEQLLLMDFANDLAFGINTLRLRAERERLEHEIVKSVEREQERIGRDLHDGLCQMLVGAKFYAGILQGISKSQFPEVKPQARTLEGILNQTIAQARDLSRSLNPARITPANLAGALQGLADSVDGTLDTRCSCQFPKPVKISSHQAAEQVYRIAQEAVQNAVKHACAKNISIMLTSQDGHVLLSVEDDGVGIALRRKRSGMGLRNMETRARLIGGRLKVVRRERGGTAVACELPSHQKNEQEISP